MISAIIISDCTMWMMDVEEDLEEKEEVVKRDNRGIYAQNTRSI